MDLWYTFNGEPFKHGINSLETNADVCKLIGRISQEGHEGLQIFMEHNLSVPQEVPELALPPIQNTGGGKEEERQNVGEWEREGEGAQADFSEWEGEGEGEVAWADVGEGEGEGDGEGGKQGFDADVEGNVRGLVNDRLEAEISDFKESDEEVAEFFGDPKVVDAEEVQAAVERGREKSKGKRLVVEEDHAHGETTAEKRRVPWNGLVRGLGVELMLRIHIQTQVLIPRLLSP